MLFRQTKVQRYPEITNIYWRHGWKERACLNYGKLPEATTSKSSLERCGGRDISIFRRL